MIEVQVTFVYNGKYCVHGEGFMTPCVPRVGETYSVQYWDCPILAVNWATWRRMSSEESAKEGEYERVIHATIYVDVSETKLEWKTIK